MRATATLLILALWSLVAAAAEIKSVYSDLDVEKCQLTNQSHGEGDWAEWECPGINGIPVRVSEDDLRFAVSFGADAAHQCAAQQTFGSFNSLGPKIEWRIVDGKIFATILRWYLNSDNVKSSWLVVTKFDGTDACHAAYVDATLPDANLVARQKADELSPGFHCAKDRPEIVSSKTIELGELASGWPCPVE